MKILKKIILLPLKKSQQTHLLLLRPYPSWLLLLIRRFETVCDNVKFLVLDEIEELPLLNSKWVDCFLLTVFCNPENIIESIYYKNIDTSITSMENGIFGIEHNLR